MTGTDLLPFDQTVSHRKPVVFIQDGAVYANSRDVAAFFEKRHGDVLHTVISMLKTDPDLGLRDFTYTPYTDPQNGQSYPGYDLTRDGFVLLAMSFTGGRALRFKRRYITAFNDMESTLRAAPPVIDVRDPNQLRLIAAQLIEINSELQAKVTEQQQELQLVAPKAKFFDDFASADGNYNLSNAARILGIPPHKFTRDLRSEYLFKQGGDLVPYSRWMKLGYFVVKVITFGGVARHQTLITPQGLQHFTKRFDAKPTIAVLSSTGLFQTQQAH